MSDGSVPRRDLMKTVGVGATLGLSTYSGSAETLSHQCPAVEYNLNTGYDQDAGTTLATGADDDDWEITASDKNGTVPRPATVVDPRGNWAGPFQDSKWISLDTDWGSPLPSPDSYYEYEYCFCLHEEFQNPSLDVSLWADDQVTDIVLNGQSLSFSGNGNFGGDPIEEVYDDPGLFTAGENCLTVVVADTAQYATGLNVAGTMTAENADCDCCAGPCDVSVHKRAEGTFEPGSTNQYVIEVCNTCADQACEAPVEVTDQLPDAVTAVGASGTGWDTDVQNGTVAAQHPNEGGLGPGECLPELVIDVEVPSILRNCVEATVPEYEQTASHCIEHELGSCGSGDECSLSVEKATGGQFYYGQAGTYEIRVCNTGETECAAPVSIKDDLPDGMRVAGVGGTDWNASVNNGTVVADHPNSGGLAPGDCLPTLTIEVEVPTIDNWPGDSDEATNCALLYIDGSLDQEGCVTHVIYAP